ncbi:unnamed protein product [Darwinula stevensoni]|uniref:Phosphomannomutase n=1 Tax=Darwinula stevensoni TaxID=69355 RepID=A0A7R9A573_9CRUS|nr:unnamed protein product [Darwinula stevensoni]CAG0893822.1 unnamed protein product [Darwinula stevensoni]
MGFTMGDSFISRDEKKLYLFDVDGTLTPSRQPIDDDMDKLLKRLRQKVVVGVVGGSDLPKIVEQLGKASASTEEVLLAYDFTFSENGLVAHKGGQLLDMQSIEKHMGEEKLQEMINFSLRYMSNIHLPFKRGNFVEFRHGMINLSPVGRSVTLEERQAFVNYEATHPVRQKFLNALKEAFPHYGLEFVIGGQISVDVYPVGWDKTYCLRHIEKESFSEIHFFGDKTMPGGNDHALYEDPRTIGHSVSGPADTKNQILEHFPDLKS